MTIYEVVILAYQATLGALVLCIMLPEVKQMKFLPITPMKRTVLTLLGVYLCQLALAAALWDSWTWDAAMIPLNLLAARLILWQPAGRLQAIIGATFIPQALIHLGRVINVENANMDLHFWGLSLLGFAQLALLGGWWLNDYFHSRRSRNSTSDPMASPAYRQGMDP